MRAAPVSLAAMRFATEMFAALCDALAFGQMHAATRANDHVFAWRRGFQFVALVAKRTQQPVHEGDRQRNKDQP